MLHSLPHQTLSYAAVQAEWTNTLDRIQQRCLVQRAAEVVRPDKFAYITLDHDHEHMVADIERILFQNLLLRPLHRIVDRGTIEFQADWLWHWRQSVPWHCERSSSVNRLFPDAPERMYIYRYNLLLVE
ncbi:MAG: hypothetical protein KDC00_06020 [Flavobacteriales bacterium]|nr:hypothetical protein [Flavobacteriales bacterium]